MTTEEQLPDMNIPNLGGTIVEDDIYYKGKFKYSAWAKTAQRIRDNAPNWYFALEPNPEGGFVFKAPNNTGYIMGYFQNIVSGTKLPLYPYAITAGYNKPVSFDEISANDIQNSHRRCLCACACYSFGDAFELWAQIEIKGLDQEEEEKEDRIKRTPDKPNDKGEPVESIEDKNYGKPISKYAKDAVVTKMMNLKKQYPNKKKSVIDKFKKMFDITAEGIGPDDIRTAEQGKALTLLINEIDSTL